MNKYERVFRFGHEREEVRGEWRKLHYEELRGLCFSPYTIQMIE